MKLDTKKLAYAGICLALCLLLPFLTGQIPSIGSKISPMHIPAFLCGYLAGWPYALVMGAVAPILRYFIFGMPHIMPTGMAMAFELAAYGAIAAIAYKKLPKNNIGVYASLITAMLLGRVVWGAASFVIYAIMGNPFTLAIFFAKGFLEAIPAIVIHIVLIPPIVIGLKRAGFLESR